MCQYNGTSFCAFETSHIVVEVAERSQSSCCCSICWKDTWSSIHGSIFPFGKLVFLASCFLLQSFRSSYLVAHTNTVRGGTVEGPDQPINRVCTSIRSRPVGLCLCYAQKSYGMHTKSYITQIGDVSNRTRMRLR